MNWFDLDEEARPRGAEEEEAEGVKTLTVCSGMCF